MNTNPQENDEHSDEETANGGREVVQPSEEEPIEGGDITGLDEPLGAFNREKHEAVTARRLSYLFVGVLAGYFVLHYAATFAAAMWLDPGAQDLFQDIYNAGLPVLSGLAGSAATYFFTRRNA